MTMPTPTPYGLREVDVTPFTDATSTTLGTRVKLPVARTLSFTENEEYTALEGDDKVQAQHGSGPSVDWSLEAGGYSFEAVRVMYGGTIEETGVTPNRV